VILDDKKVEIDYPVKWKYKVIMHGNDSIDEVLGCIGGKEYSCTPSNVSKKGKFASHNLEILVFSEEERLAIYQALLEHRLTIRVL
jgi:putative lipoic acid-binding regulatory protein